MLGRARNRRGDGGQALPVVLGAAAVVLLVAGVLAAVGGAVSRAEGAQRGADLAALSAVRSMRDDLPRLVAPFQVAQRTAGSPCRANRGEEELRSSPGGPPP